MSRIGGWVAGAGLALALLGAACNRSGSRGGDGQLAVPGGVVAISPASGEVRVSWSTTAPRVSFNIYWGVSPGVTKVAGTRIEGVSSPHLHSGLTDGTTYYYVVTTLAGGLESPESAEASAMPLSAPMGPTARGATGEVTVDWIPVAEASSYNLYWATTPGVTRATGTLISGVTSPHVHMGLTDGISHYYVVTALNTVGGGAESAQSVEVSAMPLSAPTGPTATGATGEVTIDWTAVTGASSHSLYWDTTPGVTRATGNPEMGVTSPYLHVGLTNGTTYYYVVTSVATLGGGTESVESAEVSAMPLEAPSGLSAAGSTAEVTLDWGLVSGASTYNIYWDTAPGVTPATGNQIPGASPPFRQGGIASGMNYHYVVTAVNTVGGGTESAASSEASATALDAPAAPSAKATAGEVDLNWLSVTGATTYNIYWDTSPGVTTATGTKIPSPAPNYTHTGLANGTDYYYVITAESTFGGGSESVESAEVSARPDLQGTPDPSFGGQGWVVHDSAAGGDGDDFCFAATFDVSGRILATGNSLNLAGDFDMVVWRYDGDGSLDRTFNSQGWVVYGNAAGGDGFDGGFDIALDSAGRTLVSGRSDNGVPNGDMAAWRLHPDGSLDTTFGGSGWVVHDSAAGGIGADSGAAIVEDSLGRIIVGGSSETLSGTGDMALWRFAPDGSLDLSFNGQGWTVHNSAAGGNATDFGQAITLDSSDRIVIAGVSENAAGNWDMAAWRYGTGGLPDSSFNGQGWFVHSSAAGGDGQDYAHGVAVDPQERIVLAGRSLNAAGDPDLAVWRLDSTGSLDTGFGGQGWTINANAAGGAGEDFGLDLAIDGAGRILVTGRSMNASGDFDMVLWRFLSDGAPDMGFGTRGFVFHDNAAGGNGADEGWSIRIDPLGRVLIAGYSQNGSGNFDLVLWRFR